MAWLVVGWLGAVAAQDGARPVAVGGLRADVEWLCAPERRGRGFDPEFVVARWLVSRFEQCGLEPLFPKGYLQAFRILGMRGMNVGAVLPGAGWPEDRRHVVVSAHHDHLGVRAGRRYPGAADNAAGVAAMLAIAEHLRGRRDRLAHSVVFLGFDLEEKGMLGARAYARQPAIPLDAMTVFTTMDILGRGVLDLPGPRLAVLGFERAPELLAAARQVPVRGRDLELSWVGSDLIGDRSDYAPFRGRDVPYLFFSTAEYRDYHRPTDTVDRLDFDALEAQTTFLCDLVARLAELPTPPKYRREPVGTPEEIASLRSLLDAFHARRSTLPPGVGPAVERVRLALRGYDAAGVSDPGKRRTLRTQVLDLMLAFRRSR